MKGGKESFEKRLLYHSFHFLHVIAIGEKEGKGGGKKKRRANRRTLERGKREDEVKKSAPLSLACSFQGEGKGGKEGEGKTETRLRRSQWRKEWRKRFQSPSSNIFQCREGKGREREKKGEY